MSYLTNLLVALPVLFIAASLAFAGFLMAYAGWLKLKRMATVKRFEPRSIVSVSPSASVMLEP